MIIVEGADNVGKSTLIKDLLEADPSLRVLRRDRFKPGQGETIGTSYLKALVPADGDRVAHGNSVADRFFASECIYGNLFRERCRMTPAEHMAIRAMLYSYGAIVVHCDPGDEAIMASWTKREQMYDDPLIIARAYREQIEKLFDGFPLLKYDYTVGQREVNVKRIVGLHRSIQQSLHSRLSWWSAIPYGSGRLSRPGLVLIGEHLSPRATTRVPFAHGPAGDFLAWTLEQLSEWIGYNVLESTYFTNADKGVGHNVALLREELLSLDLKPHSVIVTLGSVAADTMKHVVPSIPDIKVVNLQHPMYVRRFHYEKRHDYVQKFIDALSPVPQLAFTETRA